MKLSKQAYTAEFKELAVKRVKSGQSVSTVVKDLGPGDRALRNRVKAAAEGSHAFQDKLGAYGMTCRMSRKGNCRDNAPAGSRFNSFKNGRAHGIRYATHDDMKAAGFEYIEVFYNRKRQHPAPGYRSPTQFLESWISKHHQEKLVA
ncbi:MAG: IS3 family transposase [Betaproteobacteria bacterium]|nr:IS3 family transposase [Betaproteobacteria bacterium]